MNMAFMVGEVLAIFEQGESRVIIELAVKSGGDECRSIWVEARGLQAKMALDRLGPGNRIAVDGTVDPKIEADVLADQIQFLSAPLGVLPS